MLLLRLRCAGFNPNVHQSRRTRSKPPGFEKIQQHMRCPGTSSPLVLCVLPLRRCGQHQKPEVQVFGRDIKAPFMEKAWHHQGVPIDPKYQNIWLFRNSVLGIIFALRALAQRPHAIGMLLSEWRSLVGTRRYKIVESCRVPQRHGDMSILEVATAATVNAKTDGPSPP